MKNWTGERLETFLFNRDTIDHLHRYAIALNYTKNKVVLDIASGEGYGSNLMSENASFVYGVDIDLSTINEAKTKYKKNNLLFKVGTASSIPIENQSIDIVVSFETIEHHDKHDEMFLEIKRVLKPDGILIISTPDKLYYSDKRKYLNEFHLKELYKDEFVSLIENYFNKSQLLTQSYINGNSVIVDDKIIKEFSVYSGNYTEIQYFNNDPLYLIMICADQNFIKQELSIFDGSQIVNTLINEKVNKVYASNTYKIGQFILLPFKILKKIIKWF